MPSKKKPETAELSIPKELLDQLVKVSVSTLLVIVMRGDRHMRQMAHSIPETAKLLGVGIVKTYGLVRNRELETFCVGRRRLCSTAAVARYIEKREGAEREHRAQQA